MWRLVGPSCRLSAVAAAAAAEAGVGGWYERLAQSVPVHGVEEALLWLQAAAGLPWWAAIPCGAVALRTAVTLPLAAQQGRVLAKLENLQPEIKTFAQRLRYDVSVRGKQMGWSEKVARVTCWGRGLTKERSTFEEEKLSDCRVALKRSQFDTHSLVLWILRSCSVMGVVTGLLFYFLSKRFHYKKNLRRTVMELYIRDNCHPFKATLLVWVQIPMWVCVSLALRNCSVGATSSAVQEQFSTGGVLWFTDLTAPDSTWILPVALGLVNLLIVEIFASQKVEVSRFQKIVTNFFRAVSIVMIPVAATVPSSMTLYWLSSSFVGLMHNLLLRSPTFRRLCRIPWTKSDSETPYRDIVSALAARYHVKK